MTVIREICWGVVPSGLARRWVEPGGSLTALWPSPVNADQCFINAGFSQFGDQEDEWDVDQWDSEWRVVVGLLIGELRKCGEDHLRNRADVWAYRGKRWWEWLIPWCKPVEAVDLPPVDRVVLSTEEDWLPDAVVDFGEPPAVTLYSGTGHEILWVAATARAGVSGAALARTVAEGRPVRQYDLRWECLLGSGTVKSD
jgi:hypothetical protein